jgi:hypothetical protein
MERRSPSASPDPAPDRTRREALFFGLVFGLAYAALAVVFFTRAPRLFQHLDQVFDADLGVWSIAFTRPTARLPYYTVHPLITLYVLPWGSALRELLRWFGVHPAGRLAAGLLCALAGGATVGAFRLLLERLGVRASRARWFTLALALSATQIVFSSLPESHAFYALSLVLVFLVAAPPRRSTGARLAAGVFSFGVTATGLVAVACTHLDWRRHGWRAPLVAARVVALVVIIAAALSLLQLAVFRGAQPFFIWEPLGEGYTSSVVRPSSLTGFAERAATVATYVVFVGLAAPQVIDEGDDAEPGPLDFAETPVPDPRPAGLIHALVWTGLVAMAVWGLGRHRGAAGDVLIALVEWLAFLGVMHLFFGRSLFLFSGQWVFAVVALTAAGLEALTLGRRGERLISAGIALVVGLQVVANASLVAEVVSLFSRP